MKGLSEHTIKYSLFGILLGCLFPLLATMLEMQKLYGGLSLSQAFEVQSSSALLWIIDSAAIFLGIFAYLIGRKIDAFKTNADQLIRAKNELLFQAKMATLGQMTAGIAHEIKNPLNFITNFAESSVELCEEFYVYLESFEDSHNEDDISHIRLLLDDLKGNSFDIRENGLRINHIVMTIMDQARGTKQDKIHTRVSNLVQEYLNLALISYRAKHPSFALIVETNFNEEDLARINPSSFGRVLLNIFTNALDALNKKLQEADGKFTPCLSVTTSRRDNQLSIIIKDNGPGILNDVRDTVFDPFFTTKPDGHGNIGLGLSICKDIIENEHKGMLFFDSESGIYTAFTIVISTAIGHKSKLKIKHDLSSSGFANQPTGSNLR